MSDQDATNIAQAVENELENGPVDQDWLVDELSEKHDVPKQTVLVTLREMMDQDEVCYSLDWNLTLDSRGALG